MAPLGKYGDSILISEVEISILSPYLLPALAMGG